MTPINGLGQSLANLSLQPTPEQQKIQELQQELVQAKQELAQYQEAERQRLEAEREKLRSYLPGIDGNQKVYEYLKTASDVTIGEYSKPVNFETFTRVMDLAEKVQSVNFHADKDFFKVAGKEQWPFFWETLTKMSGESYKGEGSAAFFHFMRKSCPQLKTVVFNTVRDGMSCLDLRTLSEQPLTNLKVYYGTIASVQDPRVMDYHECDLNALTTWNQRLQKIEIESADGTVLPDVALESIIKSCTKLQHLAVVTRRLHSPKCEFVLPKVKILQYFVTLPELEYLELSRLEGDITADIINLFGRHQKLQHLKLGQDKVKDMPGEILDKIDTGGLKTLDMSVCVTWDRAEKFFDQRKLLQKFSFVDELGRHRTLSRQEPQEKKECKDDRKSSQ